MVLVSSRIIILCQQHSSPPPAPSPHHGAPAIHSTSSHSASLKGKPDYAALYPSPLLLYPSPPTPRPTRTTSKALRSENPRKLQSIFHTVLVFCPSLRLKLDTAALSAPVAPALFQALIRPLTPDKRLCMGFSSTWKAHLSPVVYDSFSDLPN